MMTPRPPPARVMAGAQKTGGWQARSARAARGAAASSHRRGRARPRRRAEVILSDFVLLQDFAQERAGPLLGELKRCELLGGGRVEGCAVGDPRVGERAGSRTPWGRTEAGPVAETERRAVHHTPAGGGSHRAPAGARGSSAAHQSLSLVEESRRSRLRAAGLGPAGRRTRCRLGGARGSSGADWSWWWRRRRVVRAGAGCPASPGGRGHGVLLVAPSPAPAPLPPDAPAPRGGSDSCSTFGSPSSLVVAGAVPRSTTKVGE